jgi:LuxR family transcriptional regulator, maltose regulon positive regulatory protein
MLPAPPETRDFYGSLANSRVECWSTFVFRRRLEEMPASIDGSLLEQTANLAPGGTGQRLVQRCGLFERLSSAGAGGVVVVCAPAGSGKSVLVRSWAEAARLGDRLAWVSIERDERDGQRFWLSVIGAVADVVESIDRPAPSPDFRGELAVERLLAGLGALEERVVLVIDDLHELRSAAALGWLELFLARRPAKLLVVLTTREDPRLGLHRLRLAGELTELRGPDLLFSIDETRELLEAEGVALSDAGLASLHERTEGWAAGLRLAVMSLARHPDPERFVSEFSGSERTVAGYLLAEVLERQPAEVRDLLLRTSILERVSGPLADFLAGEVGAERILQKLEDDNMFVSSLDVSRSWFRYHHLLADLLQLELRRIAPHSVVPLHRAAADWYAEQGYVVEAIRHAQAARDWPHASRLLEDNWFDLTLDGRIETVDRLLSGFPKKVAAANAELALVAAAVRLLAGELEESAAYVELAQRSADSVPVERRQRFDVQLAVMRLVLARWRGDLGTALNMIRSLEPALAAQPPGERTLSNEFRAVALQNVGIAELWSSRLEDARRDLEHALELARRAGRPWLEVAELGHLAAVGLLGGLPISAGLRHSEQALRIADEHGWNDDPAIVTPLAAGAMALLWLGRFDECDKWLERAERVLQPGGEPGTELIVHHARGLLHLVQRRFDQALTVFRQAERMQALLAGEHALTIEMRNRMLQAHIAAGDTSAARAELDRMATDERDRAETRITVALISLREDDPRQAVEALAPTIERKVTALRPVWPAIEASLLDAVARQRLGERRAAEDSLERALALAEPDGIILPFILTPVGELLEGYPRYRTAHATLLRTILGVRAGSSAPARGEPASLLDELSEAELRVVRYLPSNLKAPEIAAELCVSGNTVRTHLRHIYAKLDAHNRNDAVARARELGLLAPSLRSR